MWRHWSAPVLKVICACFAPTGIHYLHSCSPEARAGTGSVDGGIYFPIFKGHIHIYTARLTDSGGCSVRIILRSPEISSSAAQAAVAASSSRHVWLLNKGFPNEENQQHALRVLRTLSSGRDAAPPGRVDMWFFSSRNRSEWMIKTTNHEIVNWENIGDFLDHKSNEMVVISSFWIKAI